MYDEIGLQTKDMLTLHRFNDLVWFPIDSYPLVQIPTEVKEILNKGPIYDFHNFIKILINGKWINVDATFDKPLKKYGFIINENWNGKTDMIMCIVGTTKIWDCGHQGLEMKSKMTALLPENIQRNRLLFLKKLTEWISELRNKDFP